MRVRGFVGGMVGTTLAEEVVYRTSEEEVAFVRLVLGLELVLGGS